MDWIKRQDWGQLALAGVVQSIVGLVLVWIIKEFINNGAFKDALIGVTILVLVVGTFAYLLLEPWRQNARSTKAAASSTVDFFKDREAASTSEHSIQSELRATDSMWAAWYTGHYVAVNDLFAKYPVVQRLILLDPDGAVIEKLAASFDSDIGVLVAQIRDTTSRASRSNVEVRWYDGPLTPMVIANPTSKDRIWIRLEMAVAGGFANRPSIVIRGSDFPDLADWLKGAYESLWKLSRPHGDRRGS